MIKLRRMRWAGNGREEGGIKGFGRKTRRKDLSMDGKIMVKWNLRTWVWNEFIWLRIGTSGSFCEHGNEPSGSIQCSELPEQLSASQEGLSSMQLVSLFWPLISFPACWKTYTQHSNSSGSKMFCLIMSQIVQTYRKNILGIKCFLSLYNITTNHFSLQSQSLSNQFFKSFFSCMITHVLTRLQLLTPFRD
jgi:hypothetical protein